MDNPSTFGQTQRRNPGFLRMHTGTGPFRKGLISMKPRVLLLAALLCLSGCSQPRDPRTHEIAVIAREEGSGTRSAFASLTGMEAPGGDATLETAEISNSTAVVTLTVSGDPCAIGYVSLGALSSRVKPLKVDGVPPTAEALRSGRYGLYRPFSVCVRTERLTALETDFLGYLQSPQAREVLTAEGYIPPDSPAEDYAPEDVHGALRISGSTSVAAVMEVLVQQYRAIHPDVTADLQQTGSGAGIAATLEGTCRIGMSSRALTEAELSQGLTEIPIALDGIAVIVHPENPVEDVSLETLRNIFTGGYTRWSELP